MKSLVRIIALSVLVLIAARSQGQSTATLSGTITDPSGAVVPNAQITVHGLSTGVDRVVVSDSAGSYTVPSLLPGNYSVTVQGSGFAKYELSSVTLPVDQNVTVNAQLRVGSVGEVVQVPAAAPVINAQTMTVGQVIDQRTVQQMPLNGRHFLD